MKVQMVRAGAGDRNVRHNNEDRPAQADAHEQIAVVKKKAARETHEEHARKKCVQTNAKRTRAEQKRTRRVRAQSATEANKHNVPKRQAKKPRNKTRTLEIAQKMIAKVFRK
jgi:hypothetical protein